MCSESCRDSQLETLAWDGLFISVQGRSGFMRGSEKLVRVASFGGIGQIVSIVPVEALALLRAP